MLLAIAQDDLTKIPYLKKEVPHIVLYERFYKMKVKKLNELIDHVAYLQYMESQKP